MPKKCKEILEAEQVIATMLKDMTPAEVLAKAKKYANSFKFAIAQRVTVAIMLCTIWDFYEDFNRQMLKELYQQYLAYYKSFNEGREDIFKQMVVIDNYLDGDLLEGKLFDAVKEKAGEEGSNDPLR